MKQATRISRLKFSLSCPTFLLDVACHIGVISYRVRMSHAHVANLQPVKIAGSLYERR